MSKYKVGDILKLKTEWHSSYRVKQCKVTMIENGHYGLFYHILVLESDNDQFVKNGDSGHLGTNEVLMFDLEDFNFNKDLKKVLDE